MREFSLAVFYIVIVPYSLSTENDHPCTKACVCQRSSSSYSIKCYKDVKRIPFIPEYEVKRKVTLQLWAPLMETIKAEDINENFAIRSLLMEGLNPDLLVEDSVFDNIDYSLRHLKLSFLADHEVSLSVPTLFLEGLTGLTSIEFNLEANPNATKFYRPHENPGLNDFEENRTATNESSTQTYFGNENKQTGPDLFRNTKYKTIVYQINNKEVAIKNQIFPNSLSQSLQNVSFVNLGIAVLFHTALGNLENLKCLNLRRNSFENIPSFNWYNKLEVLDLSWNYLTYIMSERLPRGLKYLNLEHNALHAVSLIHTNCLLWLDMSYNARLQLTSGWAASSSQIKVLNLSFTAVNAIFPIQQALNMSIIREVKLTQTNLTCDCNLFKFRNLVPDIAGTCVKGKHVMNIWDKDENTGLLCPKLNTSRIEVVPRVQTNGSHTNINIHLTLCIWIIVFNHLSYLF